MKILIGVMPRWADSFVFSILYPLFSLRKRAEYNRVQRHLDHAGLKLSNREVYKNLYLNFLDTLRIRIFPHRYGLEGTHLLIRLEKQELFQSAVSTPNPLVCLSIHSGAFELLHYVLNNSQKKTWLPVAPILSPAVSNLIRSLRDQNNLESCPPEALIRNLRSNTQSGDILAILMDQGRGKSDFVRILGRETPAFLKLPELWTSQSQGGQILFFHSYRKADRIHIRFDELWHVPEDKTDAKRLLREKAKHHWNAWVQEHPDQWAWNYPKLFRK